MEKIKDNNIYLLIPLIIFASIIGTIFAFHIRVMPDESIFIGRAINFFNSNQLSTIDQSPLFFYLTDLSYNLFGINLFGARFLALFFGYILSIPLIFLIARKLYDSKTAIISAFIFTVSPLYLKVITGVPDESMVFFSLLSIYFFIRTLKDNEKFIIPSIIFLGIAILLKPVALLLIIIYIISLISLSFKNNLKLLEKNNLKLFIILIIILFLIATPILTYNYLLYKDKNKTDFYFNRFFELNIPDYKDLGGASRGNHISDLPQGTLSIFKSFKNYDPLIFILFILGLIYIILKKDKFVVHYLIFFGIYYLFFATTETSTVHLTILIPIMAILAARFILFLSEYLDKFINKQTIKFFIIAIIIISLLLCSNIIFSSSNFEALRSYTQSNIPENSLVITDSRIYNGFTAFLFNDKHYLDANLFSQALDKLENLPNKQNIPLYFIECLSDDCGWGTVKNNPQFNESMENLVNIFSKNSYNQVTFNKGSEPYYKVYISNINVNPNILQMADSTHYFYFNPVAWKNPNNFDVYEIRTTFDFFLQKISFLILYLTIFISLLSPILIIYLMFKEDKI